MVVLVACLATTQAVSPRPKFVTVASDPRASKPSPPALTSSGSLHKAQPAAEELKDIVAAPGPSKSQQQIECAKYKEERTCIVDVGCGWCLLPDVGGGAKTGKCVAGNYAGPFDTLAPCPIYSTYQTELPPDEGDASDLFTPSTSSTASPADDGFFLPATAPLDEQDSLDDDLHTPAQPNPDHRNTWGRLEETNSPEVKATKELARAVVGESGAAKKRVGVVPIVSEPNAVSGFDASLSPCGLPGVPSFICSSWLKTHCGNDAMTEAAVKKQKAANNGYDWCATMFENDPEIFVAEPKPFPWYINDQRVELV